MHTVKNPCSDINNYIYSSPIQFTFFNILACIKIELFIKMDVRRAMYDSLL